jgi:hypothetical protein
LARLIETSCVEGRSTPNSGHFPANVGAVAVKKHRSETPGYVRLNSLILFVNLADNRGPDQRRSGPHPERISSCYIKALRSSQLGSGFGAYSQFYARYYNETRTHLALDKDARFSPSSANRCGQVTCHPGRTSSQLRPCLGFRYAQDPSFPVNLSCRLRWAPDRICKSDYLAGGGNVVRRRGRRLGQSNSQTHQILFSQVASFSSLVRWMLDQ